MRYSLFFGILLSALFVSGEAAAAKSSYGSSTTIVYNGVTYSYSSTSTCSNGTAALRYNRKWWCPVSSTTSTTSTTGTTSTSTTTGTSSTSTTTTSTTSTVAAPTVYSAQLSWTIPSTRTDGTPLLVSELSGYEIYYTTDTGSVSVVVPVSGGGTVNTSVTSLPSGNYYFSISAIDTAGLKSALSTVATISFP